MDKVHTKAEGSTPGRTPKAVLGPLTMRDGFVIVGGVLVLVGSLVPIPWTKAVSVNMWIFPGLPFHLFVALLLPLLVAAGFSWRRLTGRTRVRVGSLSLDQAGSAVSLFAAAYFFNSYVASMSPAYLLGLLGALAMIAGTTLASYLGAFRRDFAPGGESVLGSDVLATAPPTAKTSTAAAVSSEPEGFGASSDGSSAGPAASSAHAANRPGMPVTGKDGALRGTAPAGVPAPDASASAAGASTAASNAAASPEASAPASATVAAAGSTDRTARPPFTKDSDQAPASGSNASDPAAPEAGPDTPPASAAGTSPGDGSMASAAAPEPGTATSTETGEAADAARAAETDSTPPAGSNQDPDATADPGTSDGNAAEVKDAMTEAASGAAKPGTGTVEPASTRKPEAAAASPNAGSKDPSGSGADLAEAAGADAAGHPETADEAATDAKPAEASKPAAVDPAAESAARESALPATGNPNPATMAVPRTGDIKATAAISRTEIDAHRAAAERAKAEAESSFGARAEVAAAEPEPASFWFALNHPRPVFHPVNGTMLATLNPGTWILCLEDRGTEYLINLAEGRPAVLRDLDDLQFPDK